MAYHKTWRIWRAEVLALSASSSSGDDNLAATTNTSSNEDDDHQEDVSSSEFYRKAICLPYNDSFVLLPMLHD